MKQININRAELKELQTLPNIGPIRAQKIINKRPYRDIYELSKVLGIGKVTMEKILKNNLITV
jgi:competence protein ComEA